MLRVFLIVLLLAEATLSDVNNLCTKCSGNASNDSSNAIVGPKCHNTSGAAFVINRCCVLQNLSVIGLDWSNCGITIKLEPYQFSSVGGSLLWLDLSDNEIHFNISARWLGALNNLQLLLVPGVYHDMKAWRTCSVFKDTNKSLCSNPLHCIDDNSTRNASNNSGQRQSKFVYPHVVSMTTVVCPPNSHCIPDGPGLHQCICDSDHHGYKCIQRVGGFPYTVFFSTSIAASLGIIILDFVIRKLLSYNKRRERRRDSAVQ